MQEAEAGAWGPGQRRAPTRYRARGLAKAWPPSSNAVLWEAFVLGRYVSHTFHELYDLDMHMDNANSLPTLLTSFWPWLACRCSP